MNPNLITILIALILVGCKTTEYPTQVNVYGLNFVEFSEKGFLFTPYEYKGNYETRGQIHVEVIAESLPCSEGAPNNRNPKLNKNKTYREQIGGNGLATCVEVVSTQYYLAEVHKAALQLGADAIADFRVTRDTVVRDNIVVGVVNYYGLAIKRINP